jgi:hypothetical protein
MVPSCLGGEKLPTPVGGPPPGGSVYEPCYDDLPAAAESNDQASTADEEVFPDYDQYDDPGPFTIAFIQSRAAVFCPAAPQHRPRPTPAQKFAWGKRLAFEGRCVKICA